MTLRNGFLLTIFKRGSYSTFLIVCSCLAILLLQSCGSKKILADGEYILKSSKIKLISQDKIEDKENLLFELASLYNTKQDPKVTRFWNPRHWINRDTAMIYDSAITAETVIAFEKFLKNKKGYYHVEVIPSPKTDLRFIELTYNVYLGKRYKINSIKYTGNDKRIIKQIETFKEDAFIKEGQYLDAGKFDLEKVRITNELQNRGYLNFNAAYIGLEGDSSNYMTDLRIVILPPLPDSIHKQYTNGEINIYTEHLLSDNPSISQTKNIENTSYHAGGKKFIVNPNILSRDIYLKEGELYKKINRLKTIQNLSELSTYKNIYVNPKFNAAIDTVIEFDVFLFPHASKWVADFGSDLFYTTLNTGRAGNKLLGVSANTRLENRNFLGGAGKYVLDLEGTLELDIANFNANSYSLNVNNYLELPRYEKFLNFSPLFDLVGSFDKPKYQKLKEESNTILNVGYNYNDRRDQWTLQSLNASWGYDYRPSPYSRFRLNQVGFSYVDTDIKREFLERIKFNVDLLKRLQPTLFTGLVFKNYSYIYQGPQNRKGNSYGFVGNFEVSGIETSVANGIANLFKEENNTWKLGNLNFSKFIKAEVDGRFYHQIDEKSRFAARANLGIAIPVFQDSLVPYVKQFFVGGPNSIRAWQIRELGPGGHDLLLLNPVPDQPFYQSGDIKMEFNLEYQFDVIWYLEGAFFIDGGNVWNLNFDELRPGSQFTASSFLDQMALGVGYGMRFDFNYFIIRFDFGYKLRNPFPDPETGEQWVLFNGKYNPTSKVLFAKYPFGNINIAINYPF